ncbi:transposable element Tcb1 transposase [Trichonephila clavipes]|nr:transposable element Tcb1 transposase [Trichonephila clavipes]
MKVNIEASKRDQSRRTISNLVIVVTEILHSLDDPFCQDVDRNYLIYRGYGGPRSQSHPPQCTTSREDRQNVPMAVTDCSDTSRTVAQHIESAPHHPVSARITRRCLQQGGLSARRLLLGLPFDAEP